MRDLPGEGIPGRVLILLLVAPGVPLVPAQLCTVGLCARLAPAQAPEQEAVLVALAAGTGALRFSASVCFL